MPATKIKFRHALFPCAFLASRTPPFLRFWLRKPYEGVYYGTYDLLNDVPQSGDLLIAAVRLDDENHGDAIHYGTYPDQPAQDIMFDAISWQTWCRTKHEIVKLAKQVRLIQENG